MQAQRQKRSKRPAEKRRLTELFIRKARPRDSAYLVWDEHQHGLALRVQPTGKKSWTAIYSRRGRPRWLFLGDANAIGLVDARRLAAKAMLAVAEGQDPAAEKKAERGAGTFAELHQRYLDGYAKKHNKSWEQSDALVRRHASPRWGKLQASGVTRGDVKAMMARISSPSVANQTLAAVSAIFSWGMTEDIVAANPCKLVERNPTKSRERVLSASELPLLWTALNDIDPVGAAALKMILLTGQRPGEIASMRREHIKDGWWEMPGDPITDIWPGTKNAQSHRVWLPQPARALLGDSGNNGGTGFVFAGSRGGAVSHLDGVMRGICTKLGIDRATPHDLRRTHGSTITALGFGRDAMNRIQNHREGGIADVDDRHRYETETKHIMEAVAAKIIGLAERRAADNVIPIAGR
jgi:integrase